jgi:uncharacterized membrane protein YoaK (UPF0700 family)
MQHYSRPLRAVAVGLSALAGFIDAVAFLDVGGFFVSFMSGNSTRLGVGLALGSRAAPIAGGLIAVFVCGVIAGSLVGAAAGRWRRPAVLALVTLLLAGALAARLALPPEARLAGAAILALAMGAVNATFERNGEVAFGVTYMTGALVKLGQRIALALGGGDRLAWLPYLLLWSGLAAGAWAGAFAYGRLGFAAVGLGTAVAAGLTVAAWLIDRREAAQSTATV